MEKYNFTSKNNNRKMFLDPYWQQFNQLKYYWHILALVAYIFCFIFGIILNVSIIVFYLKLFFFDFFLNAEFILICYFS